MLMNLRKIDEQENSMEKNRLDSSIVGKFARYDQVV